MFVCVCGVCAWCVKCMCVLVCVSAWCVCVAYTYMCGVYIYMCSACMVCMCVV